MIVHGCEILTTQTWVTKNQRGYHGGYRRVGSNQVFWLTSVQQDRYGARKRAIRFVKDLMRCFA